MSESKTTKYPDTLSYAGSWCEDDIRTWRDVQASRPVPIAEAVAAWRNHDGEGDLHRMEAAIEAYERTTEICNQCDEPGCSKHAGIGYPVPDGYRRTCSTHVDKDAP